jgi:hypothetical protein
MRIGARKKVWLVILPTVVFFIALALFSFWKHPAWAVVVPVIWVTTLVFVAIFDEEEDEDFLKKSMPNLTLTPLEKEYWRVLYERSIQMHIDTDKGMFQLITVFVTASVLVLGWVVANPKPELMKGDLVLVVGSLAVVLVGTATLLKHRLRHYNKLREIYLRGLERQIDKWASPFGLHTFMQASERTPKEASEHKMKKLRLSFHEAIDLYYFIYLFVWIVEFILKAH